MDRHAAGGGDALTELRCQVRSVCWCSFWRLGGFGRELAG